MSINLHTFAFFSSVGDGRPRKGPLSAEASNDGFGGGGGEFGEVRIRASREGQGSRRGQPTRGTVQNATQVDNGPDVSDIEEYVHVNTSRER